MSHSYTLNLSPNALNSIQSVSMGAQYKQLGLQQQASVIYKVALKENRGKLIPIDYHDNGELKRALEFRGGSRRRRVRKSSRKSSNKRANKRSY